MHPEISKPHRSIFQPPQQPSALKWGSDFQITLILSYFNFYSVKINHLLWKKILWHNAFIPGDSQEGFTAIKGSKPFRKDFNVWGTQALMDWSVCVTMLAILM